MPLPIGHSLGSYQIVGPLGKGGMGEVYRALDTKLEREAAIKVLPPSVARDPERLARFEREAKVLASLNHPNIATIYSLEESPDGMAIAMELVEGATLKCPVPLQTAVNYARQIADALEAAHEKGITHRDLKPANIMVTPAGIVKVLDFGLAAVMRPAAAPGTESPTLTMGMTEAGMIMGTAAYMSPEQAVGGAVDRRADIWSFGVVLWQMLTGKPLFAGESTAHILANVINREIDFGKLPETTPKRIRELLKRCLDRDVKTRLQVISEARIALQQYLANPSSDPAAESSPTTFAPSRSRFGVIGWVAAALLAGVALWSWLKPAPVEPRSVTHFVTAVSQGIGTVPIALSRDGSRLAFAGERGQLFLRTMDDPVAKPIPGTEGGLFPVFSPDGQWLAFLTGPAPFQLKKVPIAGGSALTLATGFEASMPMSWGDDGNLLLGGLKVERVPAAGGEPAVVVKTDAASGELAFASPRLLPGGKYIVATVLTPKGISDFRVVAIDIQTGIRKTLLDGVGDTRFADSGREPGVGHLVYARNGALFAATFDAATLQVGPAAPVLEGLLNSGGLNPSGFSRSGTLAYPSGGALSLTRSSTLMWVDRQGAEQPLSAPQRNYGALRISPDGGRVAFQVLGSGQNIDNQISVYDLARGTTARLTFEKDNRNPVWTPDGKRLIYVSGTVGNSNGTLAAVAADGGGQPLTLMGEGLGPVPTSVSPDGKLVMGVRTSIAGAAIGATPRGREAWVLPLEGAEKEAKPQPVPSLFLDARFSRGGFQFSPDGKWVAYESNETGHNEVYVVPYPGPGGKAQVSTDGGTQPRWNHNGRELFFRNGDKMLAVDVETGAAFRPGSEHMLFEKVSSDYDVTPDGRRFLMLKQAAAGPGGAGSELHVILNWFEELRRKVPLGK